MDETGSADSTHKLVRKRAFARLLVGALTFVGFSLTLGVVANFAFVAGLLSGVVVMVFLLILSITLGSLLLGYFADDWFQQILSVQEEKEKKDIYVGTVRYEEFEEFVGYIGPTVAFLGLAAMTIETSSSGIFSMLKSVASEGEAEINTFLLITLVYGVSATLAGILSDWSAFLFRSQCEF